MVGGIGRSGRGSRHLVDDVNGCMVLIGSVDSVSQDGQRAGLFQCRQFRGEAVHSLGGEIVELDDLRLGIDSVTSSALH